MTMSRMLTGLAAFGLLVTLGLPAANAAERRADGLGSDQAAAPTEFSSRRYSYRYHRPFWRHRVYRHHYRFAYHRPFWRHRFHRYAYYRPYWRHRYYRPYYGYGYGYPYGAYGYYRPGITIGFGFGPRFWW